ncbi:MAG: gliding motility-associated C-terminal domain-containing protein [Bacteroidetes bacterium]|nr:gliding motility-associated C-terminal domain-containing protein [Bacteroidota bacterium]
MFIDAKTSLLVLVLFILTPLTTIQAQTPSTCFEIESILVDACGTIEGENEMVRFIVGPTALNSNNLSVNWPSNSFLGICQNGTTATKVATLNNGIQGCGLLKEPSGGILPAGSKVILISSTSFNVAANSFNDLNDTLYVIFQCSGNTQGHFANYSTSGTLTKTLSMSFSSPSGCSDNVTYNKTLLIDQSGGSTDEDGATVNFLWNGAATYSNIGCTAPINIAEVDITTSSPTICSGEIINLTSTSTGGITSLIWSGGTGTFSSPNSNITSYTSSPTDVSNFYIYLQGSTTCGEIIKDSLLIQISGNNSSVDITTSTTELCNGDSILLTATGSGNYTWSTGSNSASIYALNSGSYTVTSNSSCGSSADTIIITNAPTINLNLIASSTEICNGNTATLTASGAPNYTWFNGTTGTTQTVNSTGNYYVIGYNNCYNDSQSVSISVITPPSITISSSSLSNTLCSGETIILMASGGDNYLWNTTDTSTSLLVTNAGTYTVTSTSICGNSTDNITITDSPTINLNLTASDTLICNGNTAILTASGAPNYFWFNGTTGTSQNVTTTGDYYVIGYNDCYRDSQSVSISVITPPSIAISSSLSSNTLCSGETIILTASGGNNYLWDTSDTTSSIAITIAGVYTVSSSNFCGTISESISITTGVFPIALITGDSVICNNNGIVLTAAGGDTYLWSNGNQSNTTNINAAQQIEVVAFNSCGSDTAYKTIYDYSLTAAFTSNYTPDSNTPIEIGFINSSTNSLTYHWNFGDGSTDTLEDPLHTYTDNGEYTIVLTSSNGFCADTFETTFIFSNPNAVYIPNVFTPNNDEINDVFSIVGENISKIECQIFNRWGEKLYTWNTLDGFWDGKFKNNTVSDGTYFYIARIVWSNNLSEIFNGHLTVLK